MEIASWLHKSLAYSRVSMTWSPVGTQSISFWWWYKKQIQVVRYCDVWVVESCSRSPTTMVCTLGGNGGAAGVTSQQASGYCHGCHAMLFWNCSFNIFSLLALLLALVSLEKQTSYLKLYLVIYLRLHLENVWSKLKYLAQIKHF